MFELWFYGNDGVFEYKIGAYEFVEYAFRHAQARAEIHGTGWLFDGDAWITERSFMFDSGHVGTYFIIRES
jgi:hypothetical protein